VRSGVVAFLAGALFAIGLTVAGMTQPAKVIGFLDVTGAWDPSLAFVMVGAITVHAVTRRLVLRRRAPFGAAAFDEPNARSIDAPLVAGAALFGVGWGAAGYCPGPAIVSLGTGSREALVFVAAMAVGMMAHRFFRPRVRDVLARALPEAPPVPGALGVAADG